MNSSLISIVTDLEKRSYAETGLCREYYDGKRNFMKHGSMGRNGIRLTHMSGLRRTRTTLNRNFQVEDYVRTTDSTSSQRALIRTPLISISNNVSFQIILFKILSWRGTNELYEESVYKLASLSKCWETILDLAWKPHPDYVSYSRISCSNRLTQISWIILFLSLPNDSYQKP